MVKSKEHYQQFLERARKAGESPATTREMPVAQLSDVIYEQFDYLVAHSNAEDCKPDCPSCKRLQHVVYWLTLPFEEKKPSK